jgi:SAM-dependent methyltransferase
LPLLAPPDVLAMLTCVICKSPLASDGVTCRNEDCAHARLPYRSVAEQPVLIDAASSIVDPASVIWSEPKRLGSIEKMLGLLARKNEVAARVSARLINDLQISGKRALVLIIGGGTVGNGLDRLYVAPDVDVVAFDIFPTSFTQFVADAHQIPLREEAVDAVVVQAVLEHVLDPWLVAGEIYRVLRPGGYVYADTPFLQPVHEGPYDFTRFTESGHRWLFRKFESLESGVVAGPGAQFASSLAHMGRSVVPLRGVGPILRSLATPLGQVVDRYARPNVALDGASSVYFYGRRADSTISARDMISYYQGAQRVPARRPKP